VEVAMNISRWQSSASQTGHYTSYMSPDGKLGDKPYVLNVVDDVESSAE